MSWNHSPHVSVLWGHWLQSAGSVLTLTTAHYISEWEYFTTSIALAHSDLQRRVTISLPQFCQSGMDSEQILSDSCHLLDWVCIVSQVCTRQTEFIPFYPTNAENLLVIHKIFHESRREWIDYFICMFNVVEFPQYCGFNLAVSYYLFRLCFLIYYFLLLTSLSSLSLPVFYIARKVKYLLSYNHSLVCISYRRWITLSPNSSSDNGPES